MSGKLTHRRDQYQIACDGLKSLSVAVMIENAKEANYFDSDEKGSVALRFLGDILDDLEEEEVAMSDAGGGDAKNKDGSGGLTTDPYVLKIPSEVSSDKMKSLKELLVQNKGKTPVENPNVKFQMTN